MSNLYRLLYRYNKQISNLTSETEDVITKHTNVKRFSWYAEGIFETLKVTSFSGSNYECVIECHNYTTGDTIYLTKEEIISEGQVIETYN